MELVEKNQLVSLDLERPIWERFFTVAPLVVIGTREQDGYNLAPKHMAMPLGWQNYFGFICTPRHQTYHNARKNGSFTVTFPQPDQALLASLTASPRCDGPEAEKLVLKQLATFPAQQIDGVFLEEGYLFLECLLDRVIDGFGENSLLVGGVVAVHVHEEALRLSEHDDQQLLHHMPLLAYLAPGRYATVRESHAFPYPAHFKR